ncbi:MAG: sulfur carrier protein ThiS [Planctomycetaceae bacterium]|nr:sulfur carrier protein ThiS [Planctomycetaceae bacterium]
MQIELNGDPRSIPDAWTISDLLRDLKIESRYCAVERNLELVPREQHAQCPLQDGDRVEVVTLVGGG